MNCTTCNAELKVGAATCLECGAAVTSVPAGPPKAREFGDWVKLSVRILKMEEGAVLEAARDENATQMAFIFLAIAGLAPAIGSLTFLTAIFSVPSTLIISMICAGIIHVLAGLMGGKGDYWQYFRVYGLSMMLNWVAAVPIIGIFVSMIAGLYGLAVMVHNLKVIYKMPLTHAIAVVILPVVLIVGFIFAAGAALFAMFAAASHVH